MGKRVFFPCQVLGKNFLCVSKFGKPAGDSQEFSSEEKVFLIFLYRFSLLTERIHEINAECTMRRLMV
jgi:hypothetical protein